MTEINSLSRLYSITVFCFLVCSVSVQSQNSNRPPSARVAQYANISVVPAAECSGTQGEVTCNTTCPTRESTPSYQTPLDNKTSQCNDAEVGGVGGDTKNGHVMFNGSSVSDGCPSISYTPPSSQYFTLSAWIKVKGFSVFDVLHIDGNNVEFVVSQLRFLRKAYTIGDDWKFIAIRYNGYFSWFFGMETYTQSTTNGPAKTVTFGGAGLRSNDELSFADVRWFSAALTDREIAEVRNGSFQTISPLFQCRCPETHPKLLPSKRQGYSYFCSDGSDRTYRLNKGAGYIANINDGDNTTAWKSGLYGTATVTVKLSSTFQIKELVLHGFHRVRRLTFDLKTGAAQSGRFVFQEQQSCGKEIFCFDTYFSSGTFRFPFEYNNPTKRDELEKLKADTLELTFEAVNGNQVFTINEIEVEARCHCLNNDVDCAIVNGSYTCSCETNSHTSGTHCDRCTSGYYRASTDNVDTVCQHDCNCNMKGREDNKCNELGGQCRCKRNVDGKQCNNCKHNTADLGSSETKGCTNCTCNPDGIVRCEHDLSCTCKSNVETDSRKCRSCLPTYYNITNPAGCLACNCHGVGSADGDAPTCDFNTGQCVCKSNVEGRKCNTCKTGYYKLDKRWPGGCGECQCNFVGTGGKSICNSITGQCPCTQSWEDQNNVTEDDRICKPQISSVFPIYGPSAGGTLITFAGRFFGTKESSDVTFTIDSTVQELLERNESMLVFKTSAKADLGEKSILLTWGNEAGKTYQELLGTYRFTYKTDPVVKPPTKNVFSYASGGCRVILEGTNLQSVAVPTLNVHTQTTTVKSPICTHTSDASITCPAPEIQIPKGISNMALNYGVGLDGVTSFMNITDSNTQLTIVPDAVVNVVDSYEEFKNSFDKEITITGKNLNKACLSPGDVQIKIGDKACEITERTDNYITCKPNEGFPGTSREERVIIQIGSRTIDTGKIEFVQFWSVSYFIIAISVFAGLVLIVIVTIVICKVRRMQTSDINTNQYQDLEEKVNEQIQNPYTDSPIPLVPTTNRNSEPAEVTHTQIVAEFTKLLKINVRGTTKSSIIERSQIEPGNRCTHKGGKIRIINGKFTPQSPYAGDSLTVKTPIRPYNELINGGCLPDWLSDGLQECTRLRDFTNEYILRLLGIAVDGKQLFIVYLEMANKTLKDFLQTKVNMSEADRLALCVDVAEGMNFLDAQHVVHKDLAARNCWVSREERVRVCDGSFAQDLYPDEYMRENGRNLPVRWMSPESLRQAGFYHAKSDVWSYGVLIWEVFSGGAYLPFYDLKDRQVKSSVCDEHYRLGKPHDCSEGVFGILEQCHLDKSEDRPNFFLILNHLSNVVSPGPNSVGYVNQETLQAEIYENMEIPKRPPKKFRR